MKKLFLLTLLISFSAFSQVQTPPPIAEQYRWLYEILIPEGMRTAQPNEAFKSFYPHLLDSDANFPRPEEIKAANLQNHQTISGTLTYVNVIKKNYVYDVLKSEDGTLTLNVRVFLKDPVGDDVANFREKFKAAAKIWNDNSALAGVDFKITFQFDVVDTEAESQYQVLVFDHTRGPYDRNWGRDWTATTLAHEAGHMMGIADEYQTLSSKMDCLPKSLMCDSNKGALMPHHFYFILRRLIEAQ